MENKDWSACCKAANRIADLVAAIYVPVAQQAAIRPMMATATWAEIIATELGVSLPKPEESEGDI